MILILHELVLIFLNINALGFLNMADISLNKIVKIELWNLFCF